jgi:protein-S-isoprenylcysteine O-methyltransferase Ste14
MELAYCQVTTLIPRELVWGTLCLFPISEIVLGVLKRATSKKSFVHDQGTLRVLWVVITVSLVMASIVTNVSFTRIPVPVGISDMLSVTLMVSGLTLRWVSIFTLGRYFTVNVAIHPDHQVIRTGPYRFIRHPSYTGMLIAFLGVGVYLANWLSLLVLLIPITLATLYRIKKEEDILLKVLGQPYQAYSAQTKRLIPWLF